MALLEWWKGDSPLMTKFDFYLPSKKYKSGILGLIPTKSVIRTIASKGDNKFISLIKIDLTASHSWDSGLIRISTTWFQPNIPNWLVGQTKVHLNSWISEWEPMPPESLPVLLWDADYAHVQDSLGWKNTSKVYSICTAAVLTSPKKTLTNQIIFS